MLYDRIKRLYTAEEEDFPVLPYQAISDLIRDTREGKYIYYELNASVLEEILLWISSLKGEQ